MYHLAAFSESIADTTLAQVGALQDQILTIANDRFLLQQNWELSFAYALSADLQRARINQPSLRSIALPWIRPITGSADTPDQPKVADYRKTPFSLRGQESLSVDAFQDSGGAQLVRVLAGLTMNQVPAPQRSPITIRGTGSTTVGADVWSDVAITWDDNLEGGYYQVIGGVGVSATGVAFRLIGQDAVYRPGGLVVGDASEETHPMFRLGGLGSWLEFESDAMPNVQFLCDAADTAQEIYLDIVKIR